MGKYPMHSFLNYSMISIQLKQIGPLFSCGFSKLPIIIVVGFFSVDEERVCFRFCDMFAVFIRILVYPSTLNINSYAFCSGVIRGSGPIF